jgi:hypothetical protein
VLFDQVISGYTGWDALNVTRPGKASVGSPSIEEGSPPKLKDNPVSGMLTEASEPQSKRRLTPLPWTLAELQLFILVSNIDKEVAGISELPVGKTVNRESVLYHSIIWVSSVMNAMFGSAPVGREYFWYALDGMKASTGVFLFRSRENRDRSNQRSVFSYEMRRDAHVEYSLHHQQMCSFHA